MLLKEISCLYTASKVRPEIIFKIAPHAKSGPTLMLLKQFDMGEDFE